MKQCSKCNKTYDDSWDVCLDCQAELLPIVEKSGVIVSDVMPGGLASQSGLKTGDIIVFVNDATVNSVANATKIIRNSDRNLPLRFKCKRDDKHFEIVIGPRKGDGKIGLNFEAEKYSSIGDDMMLCSECGKPIKKKAVICPGCGVAVKKEMKGTISQEAAPGWAELCSCCFPLIGIILYFCWKDEKPNAAKGLCGYIILGLILSGLVLIVYFFLGFIGSMGY